VTSFTRPVLICIRKMKTPAPLKRSLLASSGY
jgi:hypothetical protein